MTKKIITTTLVTMTLLSCDTVKQIQQAQTWNGAVQFSPAPKDTYTSDNLKQFLKTTKQPKIVLRALDSYSSFSVVRNEKISFQSLYNDIEKELMKSGFIVRDRKLFESTFGQYDVQDGKMIKKKFDTDLILELVNISNVDFATNKFQTSKGSEKVLTNGQIKMSGARAEFRVILLNENQIAGSYKFNYAPCTQGCNYTIDYYGNLYRARNTTSNQKVEPYEVMSSDINPFIIRCTQDLIKEIKN
jgi:hypothetical protein